eukprot:4323593-Pyramimonas_sp.AAC.1
MFSANWLLDICLFVSFAITAFMWACGSSVLFITVFRLAGLMPLQSGPEPIFTKKMLFATPTT